MNRKLSIVATPIGNLEDITLRALRVLKEADMVLCEDTRVTGKLLAHFEIKTELMRCDAKKEGECAKKAIALLEEGKHLVFVSDAGTPGVSDPGARLVAHVRDELPECTIEAIPGPSALTALISIAALTEQDFVFLGFLPHKKGRETLFKEIARSGRTMIFYESPHRILKTLESLNKHCKEKTITIGRELTKMHEEVRSGTPEELQVLLGQNPEKVRGEFVVMVLSI